MEEQRNVLVKLYKIHRLRNNSDNGELLVQCQKFLTSVRLKEQFRYLGKEDVWKNIVKNIDSSKDVCQLIEEMKTGFYNLEKYAVNLWKSPWRKEYHTIKLYTGFFKLNILQKLNHIESVISILGFLGYTQSKESPGHVSLQETPDDKHVTEVALDLFLAQVELEVVRKIVKVFNTGEVGLVEIFRARMKYSSTEKAVEYLYQKLARNQKFDQDAKRETVPSHRRHQQMDLERSTMATNGSFSSKQGITGSISETGREPKYALTGLDTYAKNTGYPHPSQRSVSNASSRIETPDHVSHEALYGVGTKDSHCQNVPQCTPQDMWTNNQFVVPEVRDGKSVYAAVLRHTSSHEDSPRLMQTDKKNGLQNTPSNVRRTEPGFEVRNKITAGEQNISQYCGSRGVMDLEPRSNSDTGLYSSTCHNDLTRASITDTSTTNQSLQLSTYPTDALSEEALYGSTGSIQTPLKSERTHATEEPIVSCGETQAECSPSMSSTYERHSERNGKTDQQSRIRSSPSTKAIFTGSRREDKDTAALQTVHSQYANDLIIQKRPGKPEEDTQLRFKYLNGNLQSRLALESDKVEGSLPQDSTKLLDQKRGVHSEDATRAVQSGERSSCTSPQSTSASISTGDLQTRTSLLPGTPHMHPGYEDSESKILVQSKMVSTQSSVMASAGLSSRRCVKSDSRKASQDCGAPEPLESATRYPGTHSTICDFCQKQGSYICRNCFLVLCGKCKSYYTADICAVTKGSHSLAQLKAVELSSRRSVTTSSYPEHLHTSDRTVNDRAKSNTPKETREEWSCKRCTFLNPPDHHICSICASTRDVDAPDLPEPGSRVCKHCTFYNKEGSKICVACHKTIDLTKAETCI